MLACDLGAQEIACRFDGGAGMIYTGMPNPSQMPQQQMKLPPVRNQGDMIIGVLGIRVPAEMLEGGYFWAFLVAVTVVVLGVAWLKYSKGTK
jgi:hypothetical protein